MGGKYEVYAWEYPYDGMYDFHSYTNRWIEAQWWRLKYGIKYKNVGYVVRAKNK